MSTHQHPSYDVEPGLTPGGPSTTGCAAGLVPAPPPAGLTHQEDNMNLSAFVEAFNARHPDAPVSEWERTALRAYATTALWSTVDFAIDGEEPRPFDEWADISDIVPSLWAEMLSDLRGFVAAAERRLGNPWVGYPAEWVGENLWLSAERHGAGFFGTDHPDSRALQEMAHDRGSCDLCSQWDADGVRYVTGAYGGGAMCDLDPDYVDPRDVIDTL